MQLTLLDGKEIVLPKEQRATFCLWIAAPAVCSLGIRAEKITALGSDHPVGLQQLQQPIEDPVPVACKRESLIRDRDVMWSLVNPGFIFPGVEKFLQLKNKFQHNFSGYRNIIVAWIPTPLEEIWRFAFALKKCESVCCLSFESTFFCGQGLRLSLSLMRA